jgi:hypothetical protein
MKKTTPPAAPPKSLTVGMGGFDLLIDALSGIPAAVKRATQQLEKGQLAQGSDVLTTALCQVELAKAAILGNLAFAAMKAGDVSAVTGYIDIALESMTELGLETTEIGLMFALVHRSLPADKPAAECGPADTTSSSAPTSTADGAAR